MKKGNEIAWTTRCTKIKKAVFSDDHNSEGFLAPLSDGRIALFFRRDPGKEGSHVGTRGYIARAIYDPENDSWGGVEKIYDSGRFDDRNIHGGVTRSGRIVLFFRHLRGDRNTEGRFFMTSDDDGRTWSEPRTSEKLTGIPGTGQLFYNPEIDRYGIFQYRLGRNDILYCRDGTAWEESHLVAEDQAVKLSEIAGAWCGKGRMVALIRDDERKHGYPLLQVESVDNGRAWSRPEKTNIPPDNHWGCAPQLFYDADKNLLIALNSDRYSREDERNALFIYTARPEDVSGNPEGWTLRHEIPRPWSDREAYRDIRPLNQNFYGYPAITPVKENEFLVVFTERAVMEGTEQADIYSFRLVLEPAGGD